MKKSALLSESAVKDILGIDDFRHMTKDGAIEFVSLMSQMEPEVALKALEQFPDLAKTTISWANNFKDTMINAINVNTEESKQIFASLQPTLDLLNKQLEREDLSADDHRVIIECVCMIQDRFIHLHESNQKHNLKVLQMGLYALSILGFTLLAGLGASGRIKMPTFKK